MDNGEFYPNFLGCAECSRIDVLHIVNLVKQQADEEETITYERMCTLFLCFNDHFPGGPGVSILDFIGAKGNGGDGKLEL